jgi:hypothetical protein
MPFDGDDKRMTPTHAVKNGARYRYYVLPSPDHQDRTGHPAGLRISSGEINQLVTSHMRQWRVDPGCTISGRTGPCCSSISLCQHSARRRTSLRSYRRKYGWAASA